LAHLLQAKDAPALQAWYKRHLGIDVQEWGGTAFTWTDGGGKPVAGTTVWSISSAQGDQFAPSTATFMVNYRVDDLHALVKVLRDEGCNVLEKIDDSEYGKLPGSSIQKEQGRTVATALPPMKMTLHANTRGRHHRHEQSPLRGRGSRGPTASASRVASPGADESCGRVAKSPILVRAEEMRWRTAPLRFHADQVRHPRGRSNGGQRAVHVPPEDTRRLHIPPHTHPADGTSP